MRLICLFLFCFFVRLVMIGQVEISGAFEKDTVVIGDDADFTLSLVVDNDVEVIGVAAYFLDSVFSALQSVKAQLDTSQPLIPKVADFELVSSGGWEDKNKDFVFASDELIWDEAISGTKRLLERTFTLRLWDPGQTIVLYPIIIYVQGGRQDQLSKEEQMTVFVAPPGGLPANQDSLAVAPIKNIQTEAVNFSDYLIYLIIIGIALLGGLIYWFYSRYLKEKERKRESEIVPEVYIPAHELALGKLTELRTKELWQKGEIKAYQSELTYIIREYLEGRYHIAALESTTDEIVKNLVKELSNNSDIVSLKRILQVADLVKFAKAKPEGDLHETFMNEAVEFVDRTKLIEIIESISND